MTDPMTPQSAMTTEQMLQMQQQQMQMMQMQMMQQQPRKVHDRTRTGAALLAFFLGGLGIHKFYLGQPALGVLYMLFFWTFIPAFVGFLETFVYLSQSDKDFDQKYNYA